MFRYTAEEIKVEMDEMRSQMLADLDRMSDQQKLENLRSKDETHALAKRKQAEMEKLASALGVDRKVVLAASVLPSDLQLLATVTARSIMSPSGCRT